MATDRDTESGAGPLAGLLRTHRERALLTQEELARRSGLSVGTIRGLESGRIRRPRIDSLRRLGEALTLSARDRTTLITAARGEQTRHATSASPARPFPKPAQLPADVRAFTGRVDELARLDALRTGGEPPAVVICVVSGTAGVGKTALAVHWAHRVVHGFPDGQIYLNLRGFDPGAAPTHPADAIRMFLDALGVPPQRIPAGLDALAALYRSEVAGRRLLVVLDNARDTAQVRPLLPGTPGCLVLITSRNELSGLVAVDGAHPLVLDPLPPADARELLARRLGVHRVAAETQAVEQIITRSARLPLALAIVAARAATHPHFSLTTLAAELVDVHRWDTLTGDDPASDVRAVFSWSYHSLSADAARLFRLLGLHPGPDICVPAAASLAAMSHTRVRAPLAELTRTHLISEHAPSRYTFHDLLRAYAADLCRAKDPPDQRDAATCRMLDYYLHTAHAADRLLDRHRDRIALAPAAAGVAPADVADYTQALAWFTTEHAVLMSVVTHATGGGFDTHAWQLAWTLTVFLDRRGHWHDWIAAQRTGLAAASRVADLPGQAHAHVYLARAHIQCGQYELASVHHQQAIGLYTALDDRGGQAYAHLTMGAMYDRLSRHREALDHTRQALDLYRATGHRAGQARALSNVGWHCVHLGEHRQAVIHCEEALLLHREVDHGYDDAATWDTLGRAYVGLGEHGRAIECLQEALHRQRKSGWRIGEADTLTSLGDTQQAMGDAHAAGVAWRHALEILEELDHPNAAEVRARLTADPLA